MNVYKMNSSFLSLFFVVLVVGLVGGLGVAKVEAGCPEQVVSDTRECEHLWERQDLPDCMQVEVDYEFTDSPFSLCAFQIDFKNDCSEVYEFSFECNDGGMCREERVLSPGDVNDIVFSLVPFSDGRLSEKNVSMLFRSVGESEEGDGGSFEGTKKKAGVLTARLSGELVHGLPPGCDDEGFFCQMSSIKKPVGGFVGLMVMLSGLVVWRRRVV